MRFACLLAFTFGLIQASARPAADGRTPAALGSLLQAVQFSAANENVEVGGVEYLIGPGGQRIGRRTWSTDAVGTRTPDPWRYWLYLDALNPVAELDANGTLQAVYVYATRGHVPSLVHRRVAGGWQHLRLLTDHRGSARMAVDTTNGDIVWQASYTAYGERTMQVGAAELIPFGFAGGLHDGTTGLVRFGARDLDPKTGRWTTPDPLGFSAGDTNLYAYASNDPINFIDPTGLASVGCTIGGLAGLFLPFGDLADALREALSGNFGLAALSVAAIAFPLGKLGRFVKTRWGWRDRSTGRWTKEPEGVRDAGGGGRGKNNLLPDLNAEGPHSTFKRDPTNGNVTGHAEWQPNPRNPSGFDQAKRVDTQYANPHSHGDVPTPHAHQGGRVRPATPDELPQ